MNFMLFLYSSINYPKMDFLFLMKKDYRKNANNDIII